MEFPLYFVSIPPEDSMNNEALYYKVCSPSGKVFIRNSGSDTGRSEEWIDLLFEEMYGFGIEEVPREETPWE